MDVRSLEESDVDRVRFYVDGTQRTALVGQARLRGLPPVPILAAHIVAGAGEPRDGRLVPALINGRPLIKELLVLLFPHEAVEDAYGRPLPLPDESELPRLDASGDFFNKQPGRLRVDDIPLFFCDTSLTFHPRARRRLTEHDLPALGKIRQAAANAVAGIRRALEVGVIWELRKHYPEALILHDGPLARMMMRMYARLASDELEAASGPNPDPKVCYQLLARVVGLVKKVTIVPEKGLEEAFGPFRAPVFRLLRPMRGASARAGRPEELEDEREDLRRPFSGILSAFFVLRSELLSSIPLVVSPSGGLVRLDVPVAALLEGYDEGWMELGPDISPGGRHHEALKRILAGIFAERYPLPGTRDVHRLLTELAGTDIIERFLRARLLPKEAIILHMRRFLSGSR